VHAVASTSLGPTGSGDPDHLHPGPWVDQHCHLDLGGPHLGEGSRARDVPSPEELVADARAAGVVAMVTVGTDVADSAAGLRLAEQLEGVWATAGVHPHEADRGTDGLRALLESGAAVAVGECGLDHHYDHSAPEAQRRVFIEQIELANELDLPLVIHTRSAWEETFELLDAVGTPRRTVFHCFTGGPAEAARCVERGAMVSISGIVTFPSAQDIRDAVRATPLEHLLVETDTPFLAPVPYRGRPNRPELVALVGAAVAQVKEVEVGTVAASTSSAAAEFYGLDLGPEDDGRP